MPTEVKKRPGNRKPTVIISSYIRLHVFSQLPIDPQIIGEEEGTLKQVQARALACGVDLQKSSLYASKTEKRYRVALKDLTADLQELINECVQQWKEERKGDAFLHGLHFVISRRSKPKDPSTAAAPVNIVLPVIINNDYYSTVDSLEVAMKRAKAASAQLQFKDKIFWVIERHNRFHIETDTESVKPYELLHAQFSNGNVVTART